MIPTDSMTLAEAKAWLRERLPDGERCPCCQQNAKVYRRTINATMAKMLLAIDEASGPALEPGPWLQMSHLLIDRGLANGDYAKLSYWNMLERKGSGPRTAEDGMWRITIDGRLWARARSVVSKHAVVYDGKLLRLDSADGVIGIRDALGSSFDFDAEVRRRGA